MLKNNKAQSLSFFLSLSHKIVKVGVKLVFFKWAKPGIFYVLFSLFSSRHHYNFYNKYM